MKLELREWQLDAVENLNSGKVLYGGVGAGKSAAVLEYYMRNEAPRHIYVITTAKKRDSLDWVTEAANFRISTDGSLSCAGTLVVDSWNNIGNYIDVEGAFFIFDEQRVVGRGSWVESFYKITEKNRWVLLSATPGDTWLDYAPIFIANGYYKNISDFRQQHVVYAHYLRYPKVRFYLNIEKLEALRNDILVEMPYWGEKNRWINWLEVGHNKEMFDVVWKKRWNMWESRPILDAAEMFRLMRRVVNEDLSRIEMIRKLLTRCHDRLIVFYNFDYELEILRTLADDFVVAEWNGHFHQPIPDTDKWVYLVQYVSGAEGWNCVETNATVFYSMTYSYKNFEQAQGRTDRMDTPFSDLFYYVLVSDSEIDKGIKRALMNKKNFNEKGFMRDKSGDKSDKFLTLDELEVKYGLERM